MFGLQVLLNSANDQFTEIPQEQWSHKPKPDKWSKKEILGHLVDSAIHNLQRFNEIVFQEKPYTVRPYDQDNLVAANGYQERDLEEVIGLWLALNSQIDYIMNKQNPQTLRHPVITPEGQLKDLQWLMDDYVVHLRHHLSQILNHGKI